MDIKKGDTVRKVIPDIVGVVTGADLDQESLKIKLKVAYEDADKQLQERYFFPEELTLEPAVAPEEPAVAPE